MISSVLNNIYIKDSQFHIGFLDVIFQTSSGFFKLDNCSLSKIDTFHDLSKYKKSHLFNNLKGLKVEALLFNFEMDFVIKFEKGKVLIIGIDDDFNKSQFSQSIQSYDIETLSIDYLDDMTNYIPD